MLLRILKTFHLSIQTWTWMIHQRNIPLLKPLEKSTSFTYKIEYEEQNSISPLVLERLYDLHQIHLHREVFHPSSCSVNSMTWILPKARISIMFHVFITIDPSSVESLQHFLQDWTHFTCHIPHVFYSKRKVKSVTKNFIIRVASSEMEHIKTTHLERLIWKMSIPVSTEQDLNSTEKWRHLKLIELHNDVPSGLGIIFSPFLYLAF